MSDRLLQEIRDELVTIQRTATIALEKLARLGAGFVPASEVPPVPVTTPPGAVRLVRDVLPPDLLPKLTTVLQSGGAVTITAEWFPRPDWTRVDDVVKSMGGVWIRDGKMSRWEVPVP